MLRAFSDTRRGGSHGARPRSVRLDRVSSYLRRVRLPDRPRRLFRRGIPACEGAQPRTGGRPPRVFWFLVPRDDPRLLVDPDYGLRPRIRRRLVDDAVVLGGHPHFGRPRRTHDAPRGDPLQPGPRDRRAPRAAAPEAPPTPAVQHRSRPERPTPPYLAAPPRGGRPARNP